MLTVRLPLLDLEPKATVLDLGCGKGRHALGIWQHLGDQNPKVTGLDLSAEDIEACKEQFDRYLKPLFPDRAEPIKWLVGDALNCPFKDHSFDLVLCSEVLEHLPDYGACIDECYRLIKPGGTLAISVPRWWPEQICWWLSSAYHNQPGGHLRIFWANKLRTEIEARNFRHYKTHHAHGLHSPYWWLQCAIWEGREKSRMVAAYRRFLEWDILKAPLLTRGLESIAGPVMGKSVVMYFRR